MSTPGRQSRLPLPFQTNPDPVTGGRFCPPSGEQDSPLHLTSHISHPTSHFPHLTSHIPFPTSHFPHLTSHIPHPTSRISYLTSHIPFPASHISHPKPHFSFPKNIVALVSLLHNFIKIFSVFPLANIMGMP